MIEANVTRYHLETVRQQNLLTNKYGTPQLVEQAVDNEKRATSALALNRAKLDQQRQQLNVLDSQKAQAVAGCPLLAQSGYASQRSSGFASRGETYRRHEI